MIGDLTKCHLNLICGESGARDLIRLTNDTIDESKSSPLAAFVFYQMQSLIALGRLEKVNTDEYLQAARFGYGKCAEGDSLKPIRAWSKRKLKTSQKK